MEKEFVPYEQALALKELGFNELCICIYNREKALRANVFNNPNDRFKSVQLSYNNGKIPAHLYQQAFRWLLVLVNKDEHFNNKWTISYNEDYYSLFLGGCNMGAFKTELECLKKLIEIVKNK